MNSRIKISVFTGIECDPSRLSNISHAAQIAFEHGSSLLILPGSSLNSLFQRNDYQSIADRWDISILGEFRQGNEVYTNIFMPNEVPGVPFLQEFAKGNEASQKKVSRLATKFRKNGERLVPFFGLTLGVLLCGENNIVTNIRAQGNEPKPRHGVEWSFEYDVLINPAHTTMGQWNLLHKRFSYLSRDNRLVLFCTNNSTKTSWKTALCGYKDGIQLFMGDQIHETQFDSHIAKNWRLITVVCGGR